MSETGTYASHETADGWIVEGNTETAEDMAENLDQTEEKNPNEPPKTEEEEKADRVKKAASELGKKGAEAKKEKAEEEPEEKPKPKKLTEEEKRAKPRADVQARIDQVTWERRQAERERDEARRELEKLRREQNHARREGHPERRDLPEDPSDPRPDVSKYEDTTEGAQKYIDDRAAWAARAEHRRLQAEAKERSEKEQATRREQEADQEAEKYWKDVYDGFEAVKASELAKDPGFLEGMSEEVASLVPSFVLYKMGQPYQTSEAVLADEILRSGEAAPALMRHLSGHPEVFQRIVALRAPRDVVREVAIIQSGLNAAPIKAEPAKRPYEPSKAPAPIRPERGSPAAADPDELSDDLSDDEWLERRQRQGRR